MSNGANFKKFTNKKCEYYPCHEGLEDINCLFCWCPLYVLGERCGGNFIYLKNGIKDCSNCNYPHLVENYDKICDRFNEVAEIARKRGEND